MKAANTRVRENIGKIAFIRGPVTYCMEEADNGDDLQLCRADLAQIGLHCEGVRLETDTKLGHPMTILKVPGLRQIPADTRSEAAAEPFTEPLYADYVPAAEKAVTLTFLPYYAWGNRGENEMSVWLRV